MSIEGRSSAGMSVLELIIAIAMLMVFTSVVVAVMEFTLRFVGEAECSIDLSDSRRCNDGSTEDVANGILIDRQHIEMLFDQLEPVIVQPGIHHSRIKSISGALGESPSEACTPTASTYLWAANSNFLCRFPWLSHLLVADGVAGGIDRGFAWL